MSAVDRPTTRIWRAALAQVDALLQQSVEHRSQALLDLQTSRPQLHSIVASLLDAEREAAERGFLEPPVGSVAKDPAGLQPQSQVGPYRILRQLGEGGMGEVWLARRDDGLYDGEVAIKTLHPYFAGGALRERFLREAQLLGRLTHPNIARLLDAGVSPDGIVYLVLEYVRGESLDAWCDDRRLGIEARLRLFRDVCAAVAHAHANLIVHRDIKPSNILVTDDGQVKLLDFGVGKLVETDAQPARAELTRLTGRIFTPEYAAPEQILGQTITTATDVYALGVLLHVLLSGSRPYAGGANAADLERAVLHDEPVRTSRSFAAMNPAGIAAKRSTTPRRLQRDIAGDLDSIVARALRKSPAERYASVLELAEDVRRHLDHEPIHAQPEPFAARARKLVRRHRVGVAASGLVVAALAAGITGIVWQAQVAREQAKLAAQEAQKAAAVKDFLLDIFNANSESHPEGARARQTTAEELLDVASRSILDEVEQDPDVRLELMATMGQLNLTLEKYEQTEALQRERVRFAAERFGESDLRVASALTDLGVFLRQRGDYGGARASIESAIRIMDEAGERTSLLRGRAEARLAQVVYMQSDVQDSTPIPYYLSALRILERLAPSDELVDATLGLARSYELAGRYDDAIATNRRGIELAIAVNGPQDTGVGGGHQQLARSLARMHRLPEAERNLARAIEVFTFAVGRDNGFTTMARLDAGRMMNLRGRYREAVAELEPVLAIRTRVDGPKNHWVQETRYALAEALFATGRLDRAQQVLNEGIEAGAGDPKQNVRVLILRARAGVAREQQRPLDALADLDLAWQINDSLQGPRSYRAATLLAARGETLVALGRFDAGRAVLAQAAELLAATETDPRRPEQIGVRLAMAAADIAQGRHEAAYATVAGVLDELRVQPRPEELWLLEERARRQLAEILFVQKRAQDACEALGAAVALRQSNSVAGDVRLEKLAALQQKRGCL